MIIFLHGADSYRSRQKLNLMIEQFKKQRDPHGDNVVRLEGEKLTVDELNSKIASQSLLAEKRIIIITNFFNHKQEDLFKQTLKYLDNLEKKGNENTIIFHESRELDSKKFGAKKLTVKRKKLFDFLTKQKFSEKFNTFNNLQTANWIKKEIAAKNINIEPPALQMLITRTESNLWQLNNELNKLINHAIANEQGVITMADVQLFVKGNIDDNIFALTDALGNNNKDVFFSLLEQQLEAGTVLPQILTMIIRHFKIMLQLKEQLLQKKTPTTIAKDLKLHPFVVKKTSSQTRNFSLDYLKQKLIKLIELDYKIKTGQADGLTSLNLLFIS